MKDEEPTVCSNFDREVKAEVLDALVSGEIGQASYPAWDWFGIVTYDAPDFRIEIWRHQVVVDEIRDEDFIELCRAVCKKWGDR